MSIKRSIVIGEPKAASTSKDTKKKSTKKESTTIKRKVTKEALTPMGIVRDKDRKSTRLNSSHQHRTTNLRATRATRTTRI